MHSVKLISEKCIGCTDCIKRCPTEAIRVRNGKAHIINERCIDCGMCIRVCRNHAKVATTHSLDNMSRFKFRVAVPAPSFYGQFKRQFDINVILTGLKRLGFDEVFEVSHAAELVTRATKEYIKKNTPKRPVISSACPVIIRLISLRFPSLIENIIPVVAPVEIAARIAREYFSRTVSESDIGVFFITPCAAKSTYITHPIGLDSSCVDAVISMQDIYIPLREELSKLAAEDVENLASGSHRGVEWALTGGESNGVGLENAISVDGMDNVIRLLEDIENGQANDVDFIECSACTGGCVGGPLTVVNGFVAKNFIKRAERQTLINPNFGKRKFDDAVMEDVLNSLSFEFTRKIEQTGALALDGNFEKALSKMERIEEIYSLLPQIDCGSCGSPTCQALAEDVVRNDANLEDCVFMLRKRVKEVSEQMSELASKMPLIFQKSPSESE